MSFIHCLQSKHLPKWHSEHRKQYNKWKSWPENYLSRLQVKRNITSSMQNHTYMPEEMIHHMLFPGILTENWYKRKNTTQYSSMTGNFCQWNKNYPLVGIIRKVIKGKETIEWKANLKDSKLTKEQMLRFMT